MGCDQSETQAFIDLCRTVVSQQFPTSRDTSRVRLRAKSGQADSLSEYAIMLIAEGNLREGALFFEKSARTGSKSAAWNVATMFEKGLGVPVSRPKAIRYLRMAACPENPEASIRAGQLLIVEGKYSAATRLFMHLLGRNDKYAQDARFYIGLSYLDSDNPQGKRKLGLAYIVKAAKLGHANANSYLGELRAGDPKRQWAAAFYLARAAALGDKNASRKLSNLNLDRDDITRSKTITATTSNCLH